MFKKGQAAMEFLMTYGWAILVVLAAVGALAYFGVLSPDKLLPEKTTFQAPLPNIDKASVLGSDDSVIISFRNNVGHTITIDDIVNATDDCGGISTAASSEQISVNGAAFADVASQQVQNGQVMQLRLICASDIVAGNKFNSDVTFQYTNTDSTQTHYHVGSITARIG